MKRFLTIFLWFTGLIGPAYAQPICMIQASTQYFIAGDTNPTTQVYSTASNSFVANSDATYETWLATQNACPITAITGVASNGGPNLIRLTVTSSASLQTGQRWQVAGVFGTTEANAQWIITVINGTTVDLQGSTFTNAYVSGGNIFGPVVVATAAVIYTQLPTLNTVFRVAGSIAGASVLLLDAYGGGPGFAGRRADGTMAAPTAIQQDESFSALYGLGFGATSYSGGGVGSTSRATIGFQASENWTDAHQGSYIIFSTTATGGTTLTTNMVLNNDGGLTLPLGSASQGSGTINVSGGYYGPIHVGGTAVGSSLSLQSTTGVGTTDYIKFLVGNNGATEAARILHSGFAGFGTTTPLAQVQIGALAETNPATYQGLLKVSGATQTVLASVGGIELTVADDYGSKIQALSASGAALVFGGRQAAVGWSEYMRLSATGGLSIGSTTDPGAGALLVASSTAASSKTAGALVVTGGIAASGTIFAGLTSAGGADYACFASSTGAISYTIIASACAVSGEEYKDVGPKLDPARMLDIVSNLDLRSYRYNERGKTELSMDDFEHWGSTAQRVAAVEPFLAIVDPEHPEHDAIKINEMWPVLAGAIQQLKLDFDEYRRVHP